jgi:hypothetical protein
MALGEFIGEGLLRAILEAAIYPASYYTGAAARWVLTGGRLRIAPLRSIGSTNSGRTRWTDWSPWLHRPLQSPALRAECVCLAGLLVWIGVGVGGYFAR